MAKTKATKRLESAEETIARAQSALDTARSGVRAALDVTEKADEVKENPRKTVGISLLVLLIIAAIFMVVRQSSDD